MRRDTGTLGRASRVAAAGLIATTAWVLVQPGRFAPEGDTRRGAAVDTPTGTAPAAPAPPASSAPAMDGGPAPARSGAPSGGDGDVHDGSSEDLRLLEVRGAWRATEDLGTALALAVLIAGAHVEAEVGPRTRVAVEAVERPGPGAAVVTLLVAPAADAPEDAPRATRLAVPVRLGPTGVGPAGPPWWLPGPDLDAAPLPGRPVADPLLLASAREALDRAGFDAATMTGLEATDDWPFVARLDGDGPTSTAPWLRWHLDRFVVTGLPLHSAAGTGQGTGIP